MPQLTRLGIPMGTYQYMSPEQTRARQVTPQSDLYALGCILHELLTGRPVFDGPTEDDFVKQHRRSQPTLVRVLRPEVPEDLEKLVLELLAKKPEQCPPDAYAAYISLLPFLPPPGSPVPRSGPQFAGCPDPTQMYRCPNAPRSPEAAPSVPETTPAPSPGAVADTNFKNAVADANRKVDDLLDEERYVQAADALQDVIDSGSAALGARHPRVLALRKKRAAILFVGGDYRRSLPEFDDLNRAYEANEGPTGKNVIHCRRHAADCRAELGQVTSALRQYHEVLGLVRARESDISRTAIEVPRSIGTLLASEGDVSAAREVLSPLFDYLQILYGGDHEETQEVAEMLRYLSNG